MTKQTLLAYLEPFDFSVEICVCAANMGEGMDTFAKLNDIMVVDRKVLLGSTLLLCGTDIPQEITEDSEGNYTLLPESDGIERILNGWE